MSKVDQPNLEGCRKKLFDDALDEDLYIAAVEWPPALNLSDALMIQLIREINYLGKKLDYIREDL